MLAELDDATVDLARVADLRRARHDDERLSLARELHDHGSTLAALALHCELLADARDLAEAKALAARLTGELSRTATALARTIQALRPISVDDVGLAEALARLCGSVIARAEIPVEQITALGARRLPLPIERAAFLIIDEAVTNALRHGRPRRITVRCERARDELAIEVSDDGDGFAATPEAIAAYSRSGRLGLAAMHARARACHGELRIESNPGAGTRVRARMALGGTGR